MTEEEIRLRWIERAERLNLFMRERYGGNRTKFAEAAAIARTQVDSYAGPKNRAARIDDPEAEWSRRKTPGVEMMLNFMQAGLNISWWISGYGGMDYSPEVMATADASRLELREGMMGIRRQLDEMRESVDKLLVAL